MPTLRSDSSLAGEAAFWVALCGLLPNLLLRAAWGAEVDEGYWLAHFWLGTLLALGAWIGLRLTARHLGRSPVFAKWLYAELVVCWFLFARLIPADLMPVTAAFCFISAALALSAGSLLICFAAGTLLGTILLPLGWLKGYETLFGPAGFDTYLAVFQTNPAEAAAYVSRFLGWQHFLPLLLYLGWSVFSWWLVDCVRDRHAGWPQRRVAVALVVLAVAGLAAFPQGVQQRWNIFSGSLVRYNREVARQSALLAGMQANPAKSFPQPAGFRGNLIFVIGESTSRRHMALYGYHRPTTPFLSSARERLLVHDNTVSLHTHTILALPPMFQGGGDSRGVGSETGPPVSLISTLRQGGFTTYWLSNQNEFGLWDNLVSLIGKEADHVKFFRKSYGETIRNDVYDQDMLPELARVLAEPGQRKAIFVHLYAAHHPYSQGTPPDQRSALDPRDGLGPGYYGKLAANDQEINCYDNAIRSVDYLLERIVALADAQTPPTVVGFLPDHGENPADGSYHNSSRHSAYQVEIPHVWYFNAAARRTQPSKVEAFARNRDKLYIPRDFTPTVLSLLDFPSKTFDPERSLFSSAYRPSSAEILCDDAVCLDYGSLDSPRPLDSLEVARLNLGRLRAEAPDTWRRIWAHRVDTIGKLLAAKEYFAGVEADIVFDPHVKEFFVYHPPVANVGLTLGSYLEAARDRPDMHLWLDWKNASPENLAAALARFDQLDGQFAIKRRSIIETDSNAQFEALSRLGTNGYRHAYYSPTGALAKCAGSPDTSGCRELVASVAAVTRRVGASLVSYDAAAGDALRRHREPLRGFGLICWDLEVDVTKGNALSRLGDVTAHDAYLVSFRTPFDR